MAMVVWTHFSPRTHMILSKHYFRIWHISWALENIPHLVQLFFCATAMTICHFNWPLFFLLKWQNLSVCFTFCMRKTHSLKTCPQASGLSGKNSKHLTYKHAWSHFLLVHFYLIQELFLIFDIRMIYPGAYIPITSKGVLLCWLSQSYILIKLDIWYQIAMTWTTQLGK